MFYQGINSREIISLIPASHCSKEYYRTSDCGKKTRLIANVEVRCLLIYYRCWVHV